MQQFMCVLASTNFTNNFSLNVGTYIATKGSEFIFAIIFVRSLDWFNVWLSAKKYKLLVKKKGGVRDNCEYMR